MRFNGFRLRKRYKGVWYQGAVQKMGWHSVRGYGAKVLDEDGYSEIVRIAVLVKLQQHRNVNENENSKGKEEGSEVLRQLDAKFKGAEVRKQFGYLGTFTGYIREIWEHEELGYLVNVRYEDGDIEDISLGEMCRILVKLDAQCEVENAILDNDDVHEEVNFHSVPKCGLRGVEKKSADVRLELVSKFQQRQVEQTHTVGNGDTILSYTVMQFAGNIRALLCGSNFNFSISPNLPKHSNLPTHQCNHTSNSHFVWYDNPFQSSRIIFNDLFILLHTPYLFSYCSGSFSLVFFCCYMLLGVCLSSTISSETSHGEIRFWFESYFLSVFVLSLKAECWGVS